MSKKKTTNLAVSVRQRLLNLSRERQETFNLVLGQYAIERFLFRLSQAPFADQFVLKGATLFAVWSGKLHRPTRDVDLLGFGDSSNARLKALFSTLCELPVEPDGLVFDAGSIHVEEIRELQEYGGKRIILSVRLDTAVIPLRIDVGFGDIVTPGAAWLTYPTLLPFPEPYLRTYPKESVVAEKFQAMVMLGMSNSRMKDFYDLRILSRQFPAFVRFFQHPLFVTGSKVAPFGFGDDLGVRPLIGRCSVLIHDGLLFLCHCSFLFRPRILH
jgi:hypothetical protein